MNSINNAEKELMQAVDKLQSTINCNRETILIYEEEIKSLNKALYKKDSAHKAMVLAIILLSAILIVQLFI